MSNKVILTDHRGTFEFGTTEFEPLIKNQLDLLIGYRDDGRIPSKKLLDDIDAYRWLLDFEDVEVKILEYFKVKRKILETESLLVTSSAVCRKIGWKGR